MQEQLEFDLTWMATSTPPSRMVPSAPPREASLVAYDVSARGGLQHVYVGEATLESSGLVTWHYREELPLHLLDGEGVALVGLGEPSSARFDDAPLPESDLTLLKPGELPSANVEAEGVPDTGTGGASDDLP
jgi:hypothetical protein